MNAASEWISVNDRLPGKKEMNLLLKCRNFNGDVVVTFIGNAQNYNFGKYRFDGKEGDFEVIEWAEIYRENV